MCLVTNFLICAGQQAFSIAAVFPKKKSTTPTWLRASPKPAIRVQWSLANMGGAAKKVM